MTDPSTKSRMQDISQKMVPWDHFYGLAQDYLNSIALVMDWLQYSTKP